MTKTSIFLIALLATVSGCSNLAANREKDPIETRVESFLAKMTLEEKVGQMTQVTLEVVAASNWMTRSSPTPSSTTMSAQYSTAAARRAHSKTGTRLSRRFRTLPPRRPGWEYPLSTESMRFTASTTPSERRSSRRISPSPPPAIST